MSLAVRWFLRGAATWLGIGLLLGLWMGLDPARTPLLRAAHLHALLAGFVVSMIFGVAYHVLPRFSGRALPVAWGPSAHVVLANAGVAGIVGGLLVRGTAPALGGLLVPLGGFLFLSGAALFIHAIWTFTERPEWLSSIQKSQL